MKYFDAMGNIRRLQRYTQEQQLIDDLRYTYCGNQVQNITDYAGPAEQYAVKEYQDLNTTDSVEQFYDPNGNLIIDLDRGITHIAYNLLNLPDTICFSNGNRIINDYDATGRKWQSQTVTLRESEVITADSGTVFDTNLTNISLTQYEGTMERRYTYSRNRLTLAGYMVHNSEGYMEYTYHRSAGTAEMVPSEQIPPRPSVVVQTQYYYHRDHLGNNCVVWDATNNRIVQRTWYYAGGTPMSNSMAQGLQPYKYNGKEYVEAHGYDVYDYGFRGYYATIGRFTSIDPLCERTPWQSPYAYANNNWINQIDWKGLSGFSSMHMPNICRQGYNYIVIDRDGYFLGGVDDNDNHIYISDDSEWDMTMGKEGLKEVGTMLFDFSTYMAQAINSGFSFRVFGYYYRQNSIELSARVGLAMQVSLPTPIKVRRFDEIKAALNIMSFDVFSMNIILGKETNINFFGKDGKATISQGISLACFGIEQTFDIRLKDCSYIPASNNVTISPIDKADYIISPITIGRVIIWSIVLHFKPYYESR